jgi:hypothetical protein
MSAAYRQRLGRLLGTNQTTKDGKFTFKGACWS